MNTNKANPKVGDKLFLLGVNYNARGSGGNLAPATVTKVGRKFFHVKRDGYGMEFEFHLGSWKQRTDCSPGYELHVSAEEWQAKKDNAQMTQECRRFFSSYQTNLTNSQLRRILAIISE